MDAKMKRYISYRIQTARLRAGLTQENLAEIIGISPGFISRLETGVSMTSIARLYNISDALHVDITELLYNASSKNIFGRDPIADEISVLLRPLPENYKKYVLENLECLIKNFPNK